MSNEVDAHKNTDDVNIPDIHNLNVGDDHEDGEEGTRTEEEYGKTQLTLRAIVSTKEAGVIIGKAGKNVADLREETGVRAGVSKVVPHVHDRVLTVQGTLDGVSRAYAMVAQTLLESPPSVPLSAGGSAANPSANSGVPGTHPIRLLISHNQMGTIIGRQGLKIKHIQDISGVRMIAQKEMLPQSTERVVEVQGNQEGIRLAVWEIGKCLVDDWVRGTGTVLYNPAVRAGTGYNGAGTDKYAGASERPSGANRSFARTGNGADFSDNPREQQHQQHPHHHHQQQQHQQQQQQQHGRGGGVGGDRRSGAGDQRSGAERNSPNTAQMGDDAGDQQTQNISIPADMVGCIIGRGGSKISEIRKESGARISIAKSAHDESGERMFTITGTPSSNEHALYLLYENLEAEKQRRNLNAHD